MALIERFTPGGNLYPDPLSVFPMLMAAMRRMAEVRDTVDAAQRAAWQQGDADTLTSAKAYTDGAVRDVDVDLTGYATEVYAAAEATAARDAAVATAQDYTDVSFAATGPGGATDDQVDAAVERGVLGGRIAPADKLPEGGAQAVGKGELVFNVMDYGATADGATDDGPAFSAAFTAAGNTATASGGQQTVRVLAPAGRYRIATTVLVRSNVALEGYGARLLGPITGYPRIASATPAAASTDVDAQTGGACFSNATTTETINTPIFRGLTLTDFRFGFVTKGFAWAHARWEDVFFENCNIGIFAYQGAQHHQLKGTISGGGGAGTTYVATATAFPSGHPLASKDNFFCDGFDYDSNGRGRNKSVAQPHFDTWFEGSILRPAETSVVMGGSHTFPFTGSALKVSGRNIYIPSRNKRAVYSTVIQRADAVDCPFGVALIANPRSCHIKDVAGEGMFTGQAGLESVITILYSGSGYPLTGRFENIDTLHATGTAKAAIEVIAAAGSTGVGRLQAHGVWGQIAGKQYFTEVTQDTGNQALHRGSFAERRGESFLPRAARLPTNIYDVGADARMLQPAPGDTVRYLDEISGMSLQEHFWSMTIPETPGGARTRARISIDGANVAVEQDTAVFNGTLELWARRLDTGEVDYGRYLVSVPQSRALYSAGALSAEATAGASTFTMTGKTAGFSLGQRIKIGADYYVLKGFDGTSTFTTATPLRANYAAGTVVTSGISITVMQAMASGWLVVETGDNRLQIRNAAAGAPPIQFAAKFSSVSAPR